METKASCRFNKFKSIHFNAKVCGFTKFLLHRKLNTRPEKDNQRKTKQAMMNQTPEEINIRLLHSDPTDLENIGITKSEPRVIPEFDTIPYPTYSANSTYPCLCSMLDMYFILQVCTSREELAKWYDVYGRSAIQLGYKTTNDVVYYGTIKAPLALIISRYSTHFINTFANAKNRQTRMMCTVSHLP